MTAPGELANDLSGATDDLGRLRALSRARDEEIESLRMALREKSLAFENLERQLDAEAEKTRSLTAENKSLRAEAQAADQGLGRAEHELADLREQRSPLGHELERVQRLAEEQGGKISEWEGRYATLRESAESERQRLHALELQLAGEITARQRGESQHESEAGQLRAERASLAMKLEAAVSRAGSLEQAVAQLRQQLRERDDAARAGERIAKEAVIDRTTAERRAEALQSEVLRQTDRLVEAQRQQSELAARCEMLAKALAAKDVAVEQATNRAAALSDRLEQAGQTRQRELQELEQANRRLMEQLETERSERSLVQGALDIARESRLALQKQHEQLKKSIRRGQAPDEAEGAPGSPPAGGGEDSNVRPFPGPGRVN